VDAVWAMCAVTPPSVTRDRSDQQLGAACSGETRSYDGLRMAICCVIGVADFMDVAL
jgi:hypothetical protein